MCPEQPRREPPEPTECRDCGATFNLAAQYYYDNLCPECKREQDGEDAVDPVVGSCYVCDDDVRSTEESYSRRAAPPDVREKVLVCPDHRDHRYSPDHPV